MITSEQERFERMVQRVCPGARLLRVWPLTGGVSAQVTALEIERPDGQTAKLVVREHGEVDLKRNPRIASDEFRLLQIARAHGVAAPEPLYVDESAELFPTPYLVVEYVEGDTVFAPIGRSGYVEQMADELAKIHRVPGAPDLAFLPRHGRGFGARPATLDHALQEERIRDALEAARPVSQLNEPALLHGDYWPGNILWRDGRLVAIVDWEDAAVGDPLADLGNTRLELLWALGDDAMEAFTRCYVALTNIDITFLPYWDLCAALRPCSKISGWGLDAETEARMRERHEVFVAQAFERFPVE